MDFQKVIYENNEKNPIKFHNKHYIYIHYIYTYYLYIYIYIHIYIYYYIHIIYIYTTAAKRVRKYQKSIMVKLYYTAKS